MRAELKQQVRQTQHQAAVQVNSTLLQFYWKLGADIIERERKNSWGGILPSNSAKT